jgi:hypothetical protein
MMGTLARVQAEFLEAILETRGAPVSQGFEVYRRNVRANLGGALAAAYPVVRRLVGDALFDEAAARYVRANPSRSGDLHDYGGEFGAFLEVYPPARKLAYLADVARLEWACHESHHAGEAAPFDLAQLRDITAESLGEVRFRLHPAVRLMRSFHPIAAIWEANQPARDGTPERIEGPDHVVVRRARFAVRVERVDAAEWTLLAGFAAGASLEAASASLSPGDAERILAACLARFVRDAVICGFSPSDEGA